MQEIHEEQNKDRAGITVFPLVLGCSMALSGTVSVSHKEGELAGLGVGKEKGEEGKSPDLHS